MTQLVVRGDLASGIQEACVLLGIMSPTIVSGSFTAAATLQWTPDLSPADLVTVQSIVKLSIGSTLVTPAERVSIEGDIANGRQFLNSTKAQYLALTQAQRDGIEFDNLTSIWRVLRVFLRD